MVECWSCQIRVGRRTLVLAVGGGMGAICGSCIVKVIRLTASRRNGRCQKDLPSLFFCGALDPFPYFYYKVREFLKGDVFARIKRAEDFVDSSFNFLHYASPTLVKEPPAECQELAIRLEVIPIRVLRTVVIIVLEADGGFVWRM